jgi:hypothetical protein
MHTEQLQKARRRESVAFPIVKEIVVIIVAGHLVIKVGKRDEFLEKSKEAVVAARENSHCLDFNVSADLVSKNRVCIYERWEDRDAMENFRGKGPGEDLSSIIDGAEINEFEIDN